MEHDPETAPRFATIRDARTSDDGKACVDLAEIAFARDSQRGHADAQAYLRMALRCDAEKGNKDLAALVRKLEEKEQREAGLEGLRKLRVVPDAAP